MFCASCGATLTADAQFCPACGLSRSQSNDPTTQRAPVTSPGETLPTGPVPTSTLAKVSVALGALGFCIPVLSGMAAVVTGHVARAEIRKSKGALGGAGLALTGLLLGYGSTLLMCLVGSLALSFGYEEAKKTLNAESPVAEESAPAQDYVVTNDEGDDDVVVDESVSGTRLELTPNELRVDGSSVMGLGLLSARASLGELPALLGPLRQSRRDAGVDVLRISADSRVRFGLLYRVMQTAQSAAYRSMFVKALNSDESEAQPLWDGRAEVSAARQEAVKLEVGPRSMVLSRPGASPLKLGTTRDAQGEANHEALEKALIAITQELPEQQTITLHVTDDVRTSDLLGVLEACAFAGLPYAALRSAGGS